MRKLLFVFGVIAALCAPALAVTPGLRVNGLRLSTQTSVPGAVSASGPVFWSDTTTIPNLRFDDGTNSNFVVACVPTTTGDVCTWNAISGNWQRSAGGGGSTGNWSFAGNTATVAGGYTLTGGAASTVTTTVGGLTLSAAGTVNVQSTSGAAVVGNASGITTLRGGSTSSFDMSAGNGVFKTPTGAHTFGSASWAIPANTVITGSSSATNTTALTLTPNVADGASSVAVAITNGTTLAQGTGGAVASISNNGTLLGKLMPVDGSNATDGLRIQGNGASPALQLSNTNGSQLYYGTSSVRVGSGTVTLADNTGTIALASGNLTLTVFQGIADGDGTRDWGTLATRWRIGGFKRLIPGEQNLSFSATPAFDCTAGNKIHIGTITANVTGPTMVNGSAGEACTIVFVKDGTAGAYTVTGSWGSNVRLPSTAVTFTTGAGSLVVYNFMWDANLSTPAWVLTSSAQYN